MLDIRGRVRAFIHKAALLLQYLPRLFPAILGKLLQPSLGVVLRAGLLHRVVRVMLIKRKVKIVHRLRGLQPAQLQIFHLVEEFTRSRHAKAKRSIHRIAHAPRILDHLDQIFAGRRDQGREILRQLISHALKDELEFTHRITRRIDLLDFKLLQGNAIEIHRLRRVRNVAPGVLEKAQQVTARLPKDVPHRRNLLRRNADLVDGLCDSDKLLLGLHPAKRLDRNAYVLERVNSRLVATKCSTQHVAHFHQGAVGRFEANPRHARGLLQRAQFGIGRAHRLGKVVRITHRVNRLGDKIPHRRSRRAQACRRRSPRSGKALQRNRAHVHRGFARLLGPARNILRGKQQPALRLVGRADLYI